MKGFQPLKASMLAIGLAAATCLSAQTTEKATSQDGKQANAQSTSQNATKQAKDQRNQQNADEGATTPVTPQTKKAAADSEAKPAAMSEAEALPQGTPFVPDLNLFGPTTEELRQRLNRALRNDPALNGSSVEASVSDDTISLSGSVRTAKDRVTARRIAESFATNRKVKEKISVARGAVRNDSPAAETTDQKNQNAAPAAQKQKPESPNRPIADPAHAQEKPRPGE